VQQTLVKDGLGGEGEDIEGAVSKHSVYRKITSAFLDLYSDFAGTE
jgi:hypothetical protein